MKTTTYCNNFKNTSFAKYAKEENLKPDFW